MEAAAAAAFLVSLAIKLGSKANGTCGFDGVFGSKAGSAVWDHNLKLSPVMGNGILVPSSFCGSVNSTSLFLYFSGSLALCILSGVLI